MTAELWAGAVAVGLTLVAAGVNMLYPDAASVILFAAACAWGVVVALVLLGGG